MEFTIAEAKQVFDAKAEKVLIGLEQLLRQLDDMDDVLVSQVLEDNGVTDRSPMMRILKSCAATLDLYTSANRKVDVHVQMAEQQILGFMHGHYGRNFQQLLRETALKKEEWEIILANYSGYADSEFLEEQMKEYFKKINEKGAVG